MSVCSSKRGKGHQSFLYTRTYLGRTLVLYWSHFVCWYLMFWKPFYLKRNMKTRSFYKSFDALSYYAAIRNMSKYYQYKYRLSTDRTQVSRSQSTARDKSSWHLLQHFGCKAILKRGQNHIKMSKISRAIIPLFFSSECLEVFIYEEMLLVLYCLAIYQ